MNIRKARRVGIALGVILAVALGLAAGCLDIPGNDNVSGGPNTAQSTCDNVNVINKGTLYRVQAGGSGLVPLATGLNMPWETVVDGNTGTLYFTEDGTGDCTGVIKKITNPVSSTPIEVFTSGVDRPRRPVISEGYLYFAEYKDNGSINRVDLNSGVKTRLVGGLNRPFGLAVDDSNVAVTWVYFSEMGTGTDGTVKKFLINKSDGLISSIVTLTVNLKRPVGLVMDPYYVYVAEMDGGRVFRMSKDAPIINDPVNFSPPQQDLMTGLSTPYPLVLEDPTPDNPADELNTLYFADFNAANRDPGKGAIYKLTHVDRNTGLIPDTAADCVSGGTAVNCVQLSNSLGWPMLVAIDSSTVYWSEVWSAAVKRVGKVGTVLTPTELAAGTPGDGLITPLGIATDGTYVYFTDLGDNLCCF
jgi:hypothetical protein